MNKSMRNKMFRLFILLILSASILTMPMPILAADYTWSLGSDTTASIFNYVDLNPGIAKDSSGNVWCVFTDGNLNIHRLKGTNMDNLVEQPYGSKDSSFNRPNGDDNYWISGLWIDPDTGKWYSTVHIEYNYYSPWPSARWCRRIGLATSTNEGLTWHYEGDIITSDNPTTKDESAGDYWDWGCGDQSFYVDTVNGYFYIYYGGGWQNKNIWQEFLTTRVARCRISDKMAPGSWSKWYNGSWNQPGLGGHDSEVFNSIYPGAVFYSTYLNKYVAINVSMYAGNHEGVISTCTDMNTQNWTEPERFCNTSRILFYNWVVDPNTCDRMTIGQSFRMYSSQNYYENVPGKYMPVTLGSGSWSPGTYKKIYPPVSLMDYTPYWDWTPTGAYRQDFSINSLGGWTKIYGSNSTWSIENHQLKSNTNDSGATLIIDNNSPSIADGYLSFTVKTIQEERFKAVFRYQDWNNYASIYYYNGEIGWDNGTSSGSLITIPALTQNKAYKFEIYFTGNNIRLLIDDVERYNGNVSGLPVAGGKIGFNTWYYSICSFDNIAVSTSYPAPPPGYATYRASHGFSTATQGSAWYYQYWNGSSYTDFTSYDASWAGWRLGGTCAAVGSNYEHPDTNYDAVRKWVAPKAGTIGISSNGKISLRDASGDGVKLKIMKNGTQIWPASGWQTLTPGNPLAFEGLTLYNVSAGDSIYFIVNKNNTCDYDTTYWDPIITYANTYDANYGFSATTQGPVWYYQYWDGSNYTDFTAYDASWAGWRLGSTCAAVGSNYEHPDTNYDAVRKWVAPIAGTVEITCKGNIYLSNALSDGVRLKIMKGGTQIWPASGWQMLTPGNPLSFTTVTANVSSGESIYFIVNKNNTCDFDATYWSPIVTYAN